MFAQASVGGHLGLKQPVAASNAVCSSQHPIVTDTMVDVMRDGGNAMDAAIAGALVQATVQQDMTNHGGTVTFLCWEAATGRIHELNSVGTLVSGLPPFRPVPSGRGYLTDGVTPCALIPGFMPGLKALYERFATLPWARLCDSAIRWAEEGHEVNSLEHFILAKLADIYLYTPSGRAHFTPNGFPPQVGERWPKPELAKTLLRLASEGPDCFISGTWGRAFVARANALGWPIELRHMDAISPRWGDGLRYRHGKYEIAQLSPPASAGLFGALVLGILDELDVPSFGHYTESAEALYYVAHALRRAEIEVGNVNDPQIFADPTETLLTPEFHGYLADIILRGRPKIDLSEHCAALSPGGPTKRGSSGSCELSVVDRHGNWVQLMNTLQGGGLPGEVVGGVPMSGGNFETSLSYGLSGWFAGKGRARTTIGHAIVLDDGQPVWSLGSVGFPESYVSQLLLNGLTYGMDPYAAEDAPRMLPLTNDYRLPMESRLPRSVIDDLAKLGITLDPLSPYEWASGAQMSWRDPDGTLHSAASPRNMGAAAGF